MRVDCPPPGHPAGQNAASLQSTQLSTDWAICSKELVKRYRKCTAVDGLDLSIPCGAICGFLGPNGAGKTTTIRMLMGLLPPTSGTVRVLGLDPIRHGLELRRRTGYVADVLHVYKWMKISEVFAFSASVFGRDWDAAMCKRLTERLGLPTQRMVKQLSRGESAKLGLIVALSHRPDLLILDEPTTGLDPLVRAEFLDSVLDFTC